MVLCGCGSGKDAVEPQVGGPAQLEDLSGKGKFAVDAATSSGNGSIRGARAGQSPDGPEGGEPGTLEAVPEERGTFVAPLLKPLSAKAASKVCYYLVSHFFGRSMQYKPELLRLSEQVGDFRVISSDKLKAFLDASKIMVPRDKMAPIARYYAPPVSPRTSEAFALAHGDPDQKAIMMDVDHLLLDLDKAAMRYYLNKNTSDDDVKPSPNVDLARVTELVFQMLVEDPAFAHREISDEEEVRIEELIASVDLSTVCIPIGTRARVVKANLANVNAGTNTALRRSLRQGSTTLLTALGGVARLPSLADYLQKTLSKREKEETTVAQDSQLAFDVPSWSLRAMQTRQGERNAHLQVQKGAPSLSTPQSQAVQNMLRRRSLIQQQEILAHAVSGAVKAVMLADGKGVDPKEQQALGQSGSSSRWSDNSTVPPANAKAGMSDSFGGPGARASGPQAAAKPPRKPSSLGKPSEERAGNGASPPPPPPLQGQDSNGSSRGKPDGAGPCATSAKQGPSPQPAHSSASPIPRASTAMETRGSSMPVTSEIGPTLAGSLSGQKMDPSSPNANQQGLRRSHEEPGASAGPGSSTMASGGGTVGSPVSPSRNSSSRGGGGDRSRPPSSQGPNSSSHNTLRVRKGSEDTSPTPL